MCDERITDTVQRRLGLQYFVFELLVGTSQRPGSRAKLLTKAPDLESVHLPFLLQDGTSFRMKANVDHLLGAWWVFNHQVSQLLSATLHAA
jgi:hypothetical protein